VGCGVAGQITEERGLWIVCQYCGFDATKVAAGTEVQALSETLPAACVSGDLCSDAAECCAPITVAAAGITSQRAKGCFTRASCDGETCAVAGFTQEVQCPAAPVKKVVPVKKLVGRRNLVATPTDGTC